MIARARWIPLGLAEPLELRAAYTGLAEAQHRGAAPILLWAQAKFDILLGLARARERHYVLALIVPRHLAPGRRARWRAWALAPVLAAYRQFGLHAYLSGEEIRLGGRRIAESGAGVIGECVVAASGVLAAFPRRELEAVLCARVEAQHGWQFETSWPTAAERAAILGARAALAVPRAEAIAP